LLEAYLSTSVRFVFRRRSVRDFAHMSGQILPLQHHALSASAVTSIWPRAARSVLPVARRVERDAARGYLPGMPVRRTEVLVAYLVILSPHRPLEASCEVKRNVATTVDCLWLARCCTARLYVSVLIDN
jgi:hypothetical protein